MQTDSPRSCSKVSQGGAGQSFDVYYCLVWAIGKNIQPVKSLLQLPQRSATQLVWEKEPPFKLEILCESHLLIVFVARFWCRLCYCLVCGLWSELLYRLYIEWCYGYKWFASFLSISFLLCATVVLLFCILLTLKMAEQIELVKKRKEMPPPWTLHLHGWPWWLHS